MFRSLIAFETGEHQWRDGKSQRKQGVGGTTKFVVIANEYTNLVIISR